MRPTTRSTGRLALALALLGCLGLAGEFSFAGEVLPQTPHPGGDLVGRTGRIRFFLVGKPDQIKRDGKLECVRLAHGDRLYKTKPRSSPPPPENWTAVEFDDGAWPKRPCPISTNRYRTYSLLCARVKFLVGEPQRAGLSLSMTYRGGAVLYLNGKEIKRAHMPAGKIDFDTPAESYPKEAWVGPKGFLLRKGWGDPGRHKARFARRSRKLVGLKLPAAALRKGINVLAVELHRPLTDLVFYDGKPKRYSKSRYCHWSTLQLTALKLEAAAEAPVAGPASTPRGIKVWNQQTSERVTALDVADLSEPLRPMVIHGARNGWFSGQVVVGSASAISELEAELSEFKGPGKIPAAGVRIRYGLPDGPRTGRKGPPSFDGLEESAPATVPAAKGRAAVCPVWVTIAVPADAKPGNYQAMLTISAAGTAAIKTPVKLTVADWKLPPVTESNAYYWLVQSPESLARQYSVPMWSKQHWKLIERSFALMRQVGTRIIYVPMFRESHLGNEHTMIRWIKKQDGEWKHDFSIFEKYVDTALKQLGRIDVVCLQSWPRTSGGTYFGGGKKGSGKPIKFTSKLPDGTLKAEEGPVWGTPQSRKFWKDLLGGVRQRLEKRGLGKAMMVGISHDIVPSKSCVEDLKAAAPGARWVIHCHPKTWAVHGVPAGYLSHVWGMPSAPFPESKRVYGWKEKRYYTTFPRFGSGTIGTLRVSSPLAQYRASLEAAACAGIKGFGWIGADCWPVIKDKRGRAHYLLDFYDYDKRTNLGITHSVTYMLRPGKDGPVATGRLEAARASLQENEARACIEKALTDKAKRALLGPALASRAQELLDRRLRAIIWGKSNWNLLLCADWEKLTGELYATAAEVEKKLGG
jgi:Glycoside hydrolase 123, catalytic domain/Glycoside hydrolase 123 N-terminal domain